MEWRRVIRGWEQLLVVLVAVLVEHWLEVLMDSISRKRKKGNYNRANMLSASKANKLALLLYPNTDTALSDNSEYSDLEYILKTVYSNAVGDVFDRIFITLGRTKFMIIR